MSCKRDARERIEAIFIKRIHFPQRLRKSRLESSRSYLASRPRGFAGERVERVAVRRLTGSLGVAKCELPSPNPDSTSLAGTEHLPCKFQTHEPHSPSRAERWQSIARLQSRSPRASSPSYIELRSIECTVTCITEIETLAKAQTRRLVPLALLLFSVFDFSRLRNSAFLIERANCAPI